METPLLEPKIGCGGRGKKQDDEKEREGEERPENGEYILRARGSERARVHVETAERKRKKSLYTKKKEG